MSIDVISSVWKHSKQRGTALLMLIAIADSANEYGEAWPGIDYLAEKCRMKRRNAQLLIKELEDSGELIVARQEGKDTPHGKTNLYTIVTPGALVRHGVQSSTPHAESYTPGVQNSVGRGAKFGSDGVQSSTPNPSLTRQRTGGDKIPDTAAAETVISRLHKECGQSNNQAKQYALLQEFTSERLDQLQAWYAAKKNDPRIESAGRLLASFLKFGNLPDDLPPPPEPVLSDEEARRRYFENFHNTPVNHSDYRVR